MSFTTMRIKIFLHLSEKYINDRENKTTNKCIKDMFELICLNDLAR